MKKESLIRFYGLLNIAGGTILLLWWLSMPLFLPVAEAAESFKNMVMHSGWIPVNIAGLLGVILLSLGFPGLYLGSYEKVGRWGLAAMILALTGLILFTAIQYYETLLWPAAASLNPDMVQLGGVLINGDPAVASGLVVSGIIMGLGYILWAVVSIRNRTYPVWLSILLLIGAPLFANGVVFVLRTAGIMLFCTGTIGTGIFLWRTYFSPSTS